MSALSTQTANRQLKAAREEKGLTQEALAERVGTNPRTVKRWEAGSTPTPLYRRRLTEVFGLSTRQLGLLPHEAILPLSPSRIIDEAYPTLSDYGIFGREKLLNCIVQLMEHCQERTLVLQVLPGIGKSVLAASLVPCEDVAAILPDGVLWTPLSPASSPLTTFRHWGRILGLSDEMAQDTSLLESWQSLLHIGIGDRMLLLVLDEEVCDMCTYGSVRADGSVRGAALMLTPGSLLKQARVNQNLSQSEVAMKLGTSVRVVRRWENGEAHPSPHFRERLCQLFESTTASQRVDTKSTRS